MRNFFLGGILTMAVFVCSCGDKKNIKAYYFPINDLKIGQVYEYETAQNGVKRPEYWYFKTLDRDTALYLAATNYDHQFAVVQIRSEQVVANGVLAREYYLYEPDTTEGKMRQIKAELLSADVFPFEVRDSLGVFLFKLQYHPAVDSSSTNYVIRNRRYLGKAPDFDFDGKKYPCVRMGVREVVGNEKEGSWEAEGIGEEWYARGLGLVYYKKNFNQGKLVLESTLRARYPMSELEKKAKQ